MKFAVLLLVPAVASAQTLAPLKYNHPKLTVDLGVGLWAWPVPWDVNGDGRTDLLVSCPDKPSNGVWYFENTGESDPNTLPIFKAGVRISATKNYLMPSYIDGRLRVLTPGFEYPDFANTGIGKSVKLSVDPNFYKPDGTQPKGPKVRHRQWRYADYDGDGQLDLITGIEDWSHYGWDDAYNAKGEWINGPLHGFVFLHQNEGTNDTPKYAEPVKLLAAGRPIDTFGCPSPNLADFDKDGDLDLLCGEFLDGFTYYRNVGTRKAPKYDAGVRLRDANGKRIAMDLQMIVPVAFDWNADGFPDLIVGDEDGRVALIQHTGKFHNDGSPIFQQPLYFQQQADTLKCGALATPVGVDWDGDGDMDILSGNTAGYLEFFENLSGQGTPSGRPPSGSKSTANPSASWPGRTAASKARPRRSGATPASAWPIGTATACRISCSTASSAMSCGSGTLERRRNRSWRPRNRCAWRGKANNRNSRGAGANPPGMRSSHNGGRRPWCGTSPATACPTSPCSTTKDTSHSLNGRRRAIKRSCCRPSASSAMSKASHCGSTPVRPGRAADARSPSPIGTATASSICC
jgi:hypothetical protein